MYTYVVCSEGPAAGTNHPEQNESQGQARAPLGVPQGDPLAGMVAVPQRQVVKLSQDSKGGGLPIHTTAAASARTAASSEYGRENAGPELKADLKYLVMSARAPRGGGKYVRAGKWLREIASRSGQSSD